MNRAKMQANITDCEMIAQVQSDQIELDSLVIEEKQRQIEELQNALAWSERRRKILWYTAWIEGAVIVAFAGNEFLFD